MRPRPPEPPKPAIRPCSALCGRGVPQIARKRGVPAYVVLHDSTIDGIATSRPTTLTQLRGIPGIGDKKLEHYGDELIALVKTAVAADVKR